MHDGTEHIVLNGQELSRPRAMEILRPGLAPESIALAGGLLLNSALGPDALLLNIQPNFAGGQRTYHYDMPLPKKARPILRGDIHPSRTFRLIFPPGELEFGPDRMRATLAATATLLLDAGLDGQYKLTPVGIQALQEAGLFASCPSTLEALARGGSSA